MPFRSKASTLNRTASPRNSVCDSPMIYLRIGKFILDDYLVIQPIIQPVVGVQEHRLYVEGVRHGRGLHHYGTG
jgi:hypothetical protein